MKLGSDFHIHFYYYFHIHISDFYRTDETVGCIGVYSLFVPYHPSIMIYIINPNNECKFYFYKLPLLNLQKCGRSAYFIYLDFLILQMI